MATATKKQEEVSSVPRVEQSDMDRIYRVCDLGIKLALGKGKGGHASKGYVASDYSGSDHSWSGWAHGTKVEYIPKLEGDAQTGYLKVTDRDTTVLEVKLQKGTIRVLRIDFTESGPGTWEEDLIRDFKTLSEAERNGRVKLRRDLKSTAAAYSDDY